MTKTKVALLGPGAPYRGGIVHFNSRLAQQLLKTKKIDLINLYWKRLYPTILLPKPEKEFQDLKSKVTLKTPGYKLLDYINPVTWFKLVVKVRQENANIFLTHWTHSVHFPVLMTIFILLKIIAPRTKRYLIVHNVNQHESSKISELMTKLIFSFQTRVIVHATSESHVAEKLVDKEKIETAFLPLFDMFPRKKNFNIESFRKGLNLKKHVILFFGFIRPYKGLEYLIKACSKIFKTKKDVSLLIVGELFWNAKNPTLFNKFLKRITKEQDHLVYNPLSLIKELKIEDQTVVIDSYVPNEEVFKYFMVADALVVPYISASQSAPVQVAYSFDLPVVASRVGGLTDAISDGKTGYLVDPKSPNDIKEKVLTLLNESTEKFIKGIQEKKDHLSWQNYIDIIFKVDY